MKAHKQKIVVSQRPPTFMDVAGEGGENVLHTDRQVAANDVKLLDERGANKLSWTRWMLSGQSERGPRSLM
jgi:hypothetical protein